MTSAPAPPAVESSASGAPSTGRRRSWDPWAPVTALVALATYLLHGSHGLLSRDLSLYAYAGQQVAEGVPPYEGVLNRAGPLAHLLPGLGAAIARLLGTDDVLTMRRLFLLLAVAAVVVVYLLGRDLLGSRGAGLVTAGAFLTFSGFIQYASNGPREKTPMVLFVAGALWAAGRRRWFTAGLLVSLATLCLQTAFFGTFVAVAAAVVVLAAGSRLRALVRVLLGGALPVAVLAAYFALAGALREAVDAFVVINARYTQPDPLLDKLGPAWQDLLDAYGWSSVPLVGGGVALPLVAVLLLVVPRLRRSAVGSLGPVLGALALGEGVGLLWTFKDYDSWADLFPLLPFAAVGFGALWAVATHALRGRTAVAATSVLVAAAVAVALLDSWTGRDDQLDAQRASVAAVFAVLPGDATVASVEAPEPLVLTRRRNPTRHQMFRGGLQDYLDDTWPGGLDGFRRDLLAGEPTLISVGTAVSDRWRAAIETRYEYVGSGPNWGWYARSSLGAETIARLRDAAGYDPADGLARRRDAPSP